LDTTRHQVAANRNASNVTKAAVAATDKGPTGTSNGLSPTAAEAGRKSAQDDQPGHPPAWQQSWPTQAGNGQSQVQQSPPKAAREEPHVSGASSSGESGHSVKFGGPIAYSLGTEHDGVPAIDQQGHHACLWPGKL
jgi:hypothetical protein